MKSKPTAVDDIYAETEERQTRSDKKRQAKSFEHLAKQLLDLKPVELDRCEMPKTLRQELRHYDEVKGNEGKKRQLKRIAGILRNLETDPITDHIEKLTQQQHNDAAHFHQLEAWRDQLISGNDDVIEQIISKYKHADRQTLRNIVRSARKERLLEKPPKHARQLFKYLRTLMEDEL